MRGASALAAVQVEDDDTRHERDREAGESEESEVEEFEREHVSSLPVGGARGGPKDREPQNVKSEEMPMITEHTTSTTTAPETLMATRVR